MTKQQEKEAIEYLKWWFANKADLKRPYRDNQFGKILKQLVTREGHWKEAPRWNPRKAHKRMLETLAKRKQ